MCGNYFYHFYMMCKDHSVKIAHVKKAWGHHGLCPATGDLLASSGRW